MNNNDQYFKTDNEVATVIIADQRWVTVELEEKDACHSCGAKMICRPNSTGKRILKMPNTINAKVGDQVLIEQIGANQLKVTLVQYGLPLFGFLIGVLIANRYIKDSTLGIPADIAQMLCGILAVILTGFVIYFWSKHKAKSGFNVFRLRQILNDKPK
ncbi:MAG TPA: SoxR reducing system RseC family protein [Candidatus Marinimicrobia bacterium]|nr:SoxR reducing system RseC family protein [Candidatus Neomarinimicrobiota bacterium]HRS51536.1 SoxR reducing system RseC family protein [Candidatus Neomarinimicrobiota bacterium]HRU92914.1 SoxR reducing system RseC family protein [Candidatus Neomarinimicrobiota bacterium]